MCIITLKFWHYVPFPATHSPSVYLLIQGMGFFSSLMSSLKRSHPRQEASPPPPEDLGLKTLRQVLFDWSCIHNYNSI